LRDRIEQVCLAWPRYGYRRVTHQLGREGLQVNHKRVQRIMQEESLQVQVRRYVRTTWSAHGLPVYPNLLRGLSLEGPNHVWCADLTYIRLRAEFVYLAVLMDIFTRALRGWHLGRDLTETLVCRAWDRALAHHPAPRIHHSDQGSQYVAQGYVDRLRAHQVQISMAAQGCPTQNAYAERFIRTLKEEEVYLHDYETFDEANYRIEYFLEDVYMTKRMHSSLGYLTPAEFEALHHTSER
jgi:transposase InsO family protein